MQRVTALCLSFATVAVAQIDTTTDSSIAVDSGNSVVFSVDDSSNTPIDTVSVDLLDITASEEPLSDTEIFSPVVIIEDLRNVFLTHSEAILLAAGQALDDSNVQEAILTYGPVISERLEKAKNFIRTHAIVTESITYIPFPKSAQEAAQATIENAIANFPEIKQSIEERLATNPDLSSAYTDFVNVIMTYKSSINAHKEAAKRFILDNYFETDDILYIPIPTSHVPVCLATLLSERFEEVALDTEALEADASAEDENESVSAQALKNSPLDWQSFANNFLNQGVTNTADRTQEVFNILNSAYSNSANGIQNIKDGDFEGLNGSIFNNTQIDQNFRNATPFVLNEGDEARNTTNVVNFMEGIYSRFANQGN